MNNLANLCGEDLASIISRMDRVIVDTNAEWKDRSSKSPRRAFILGKTVDGEKHNLQGEFFNKKIAGGRENVFVLGMTTFRGNSIIEIHRLDRHFKAIFRGQLPMLDEMTSDERARWNCPAKRRELRDEVDKLAVSCDSSVLREKIKVTVPLAYKDYVVSCNVAQWAYALLLKEIARKDRNEIQKFRENHEHLFGDTQLIQEALFLGASILSENTQHVWRMASYCGIRCER